MFPSTFRRRGLCGMGRISSPPITCQRNTKKKSKIKNTQGGSSKNERHAEVCPNVSMMTSCQPDGVNLSGNKLNFGVNFSTFEICLWKNSTIGIFWPKKNLANEYLKKVVQLFLAAPAGKRHECAVVRHRGVAGAHEQVVPEAALHSRPDSAIAPPRVNSSYLDLQLQTALRGGGWSGLWYPLPKSEQGTLKRGWSVRKDNLELLMNIIAKHIRPNMLHRGGIMLAWRGRIVRPFASIGMVNIFRI